MSLKNHRQEFNGADDAYKELVRIFDEPPQRSVLRCSGRLAWNANRRDFSVFQVLEIGRGAATQC